MPDADRGGPRPALRAARPRGPTRLWEPSAPALASSVTSDWQRFQELAARGESDISPDGAHSLRTALDLVNGQPFADVISPGWYEWAEPYVREMTQSITRVSRQLTRRRLAEGELPGAWWALRRGYEALPGGVQQFQTAAEAVRERYSESDSLQYLADQLTGTHASFPDDSPYPLLG